ncbi:hypothetical protein [Pseudonocardia sp. HH130630-07]|uniref:hypothetical protein n=1 Tax=Pseudonocardia sp. HH130630-07 TaxID=1690815 RepID=UPI0008151B33|nr:hypothetical protein [Pseudonocardia sp. HH130630-07]ANY07693.1 hypothetical protein AFB00_16910 [Pseudonocardia sp. HH130630-07]
MAELPVPPPPSEADRIYTARFEALSRLVLSVPPDGFDRQAVAFAAAADALEDVSGRVRAQSIGLRENLKGAAGDSAATHGTGLTAGIEAVAAAIAGDAALLRRAGDGVAGAQQSMRELVAERARAVAGATDPGVAAQYDERASSVLEGLVRTYVQVGTGFAPLPGAEDAPGSPGADEAVLRGADSEVASGGADGVRDLARHESPGTVPALPVAALSLAPVSGVHAVAVDPAVTGRPGGVTPAMPAGMTPVLGRTVDRAVTPAGFPEGQVPAVLGAVAVGGGGPVRGSAPTASALPVHTAAHRPTESGAPAPRALGRESPVPAEASATERTSSPMIPPGFESPVPLPMAGTALAGAGAPPRALGREVKGATEQRPDGGVVVPEAPAVPSALLNDDRPSDGLRGRIATASSVPDPVAAAPSSLPPVGNAPAVPATAGAAAVEPAVPGRPVSPALPDPSAVRPAELAPPSALQSLSPPQRPEPGPPPTSTPSSQASGLGMPPPMMPMGMGMGGMGMGGAPPDENRTREVVLQEEPGAWDDGSGAAPAVLGRR